MREKIYLKASDSLPPDYCLLKQTPKDRMEEINRHSAETLGFNL